MFQKRFFRSNNKSTLLYAYARARLHVSVKVHKTHISTYTCIVIDILYTLLLLICTELHRCGLNTLPCSIWDYLAVYNPMSI